MVDESSSQTREISGTTSVMSMEVAMVEGSGMVHQMYLQCNRLAVLNLGAAEEQSRLSDAKVRDPFCESLSKKAAHAWAVVFGGFLLTQGAGLTKEVTLEFGESSSVGGQDLLSLVRSFEPKASLAIEVMIFPQATDPIWSKDMFSISIRLFLLGEEVGANGGLTPVSPLCGRTFKFCIF
ncbi:hypothetical protein NE237_027501 [Protea cynaroides]|uniref:Uncharacterized protein n=1 Tax=Protea cynaroides TaxID=273540 RepID=A0A9Q0GNN6_9MAGN|nr:hypothetical protein NE237_027501 [Protea cynaroides]